VQRTRDRYLNEQLIRFENGVRKRWFTNCFDSIASYFVCIHLGYVTPPRSTQIYHPKTSLSQAKLLTSSELKRRFSSNYYSLHKKQRRHQLILKTDSLVPCEHHLKMPVILDKLFADENKENLLSRTDNDRIVPYSSSNSYFLHPSCQSNSFKHQQEQLFSIPDSIIKEKFKILFEKNYRKKN